MEFILKYTASAHLNKQLHSTLILHWNKLPNGIKGLLKTYPEGFSLNKSIFSLPQIVSVNNFKINNFRVKECKKALSDNVIYNYKEMVKCNNKFCSDCN